MISIGVNEDHRVVLKNSTIKMSKASKIIKSYVNQGVERGTVKERWSDDDYKITIQGVILGVLNDSFSFKKLNRLAVTTLETIEQPFINRLPVVDKNDNTGNKYPTTELDNLVQILSYKGVLILNTDELPVKELGLDRILVENYTITPETGYNYNYTITASSDQQYNQSLLIEE